MRIFSSVFLIVILSVQIHAQAQTDLSLERKYSDVIRFIYSIAKKYPQYASVFTLGYSDQNVAIEGLKIGEGPVSHLVVATHHGNELPSTEVALSFAESIAKNPLQGQTIYVIPVLNIEGYNARSRYERVNGEKIDLNRDYPGPCGTEGPFKSKSTRALAQFFAQNEITAVATIHTYKPTVAYPWGNSAVTYDTPYNSTFHKMAQAATIESHYEIGFSSVTMFPADGTFEDYVYWTHGAYSLLFEVGKSNRPTAAELKESVEDNVAGLRAMFKMAPKSPATQHDFTNGCDPGRSALDLHLE